MERTTSTTHDETHTKTEEIFIIRLADTAAQGRCGVCGREMTVAAGLGIALKEGLDPVCSQCVAKDVPEELAKAVRLSDVADLTQAVQKAKAWTGDDFIIQYNNTHAGAVCPVCARRHDPSVGLVVTPKHGPIEPVCAECSAQYAPREMTEAVFGPDVHRFASADDFEDCNAVAKAKIKREFLERCNGMEPVRLIRFDGSCEAMGLTGPGKDRGEFFWSGEVSELRPSGPNVTVLVNPRTGKKDVVRLLRTILGWIDATEQRSAERFDPVGKADQDDLPF